MRASFEEACEAFGVPPDRFSGSPSTSCSPSYNVCPGKTTAVFFSSKEGAEGAEQVFARPMAWGLVPGYAKRPEPGKFHDFWRMFNARSESLAESPIFSRLLAQGKRCVVPVSGFYEWKKIDGQKRKQPMYMTTIDEPPFAFAGLWEVWKDKNNLDADGEPLELYSCTIITGSPNEKVAEVHDRMPVMLPPDAWDTWLDRDNHDIEALQELLVPAPAELIQLRMVSTDVNNVRNNDPSLIDEAEPVTDDA